MASRAEEAWWGWAEPSLVVQMVKSLPVMQETWIQSLGQDDPLQKELLPTPVFLPGEFHGQRRLMGYSLWGSQRVRHD